MREGIIGIECDRATQFSFARCPIVGEPPQIRAERRMSLRSTAVELYRALRSLLGLGPGLAGTDEPFVERRPEVGIGETGPGRGEVGAQSHRLVELRNRFLQIFITRTIEEESAFEVGIMCRRVDARCRGEARLFSRRQLRVDRLGDGRGKLRLEGEHVARLALETLCPEMLVGAASIN